MSEGYRAKAGLIKKKQNVAARTDRYGVRGKKKKTEKNTTPKTDKLQGSDQINVTRLCMNSANFHALSHVRRIHLHQTRTNYIYNTQAAYGSNANAPATKALEKQIRHDKMYLSCTHSWDFACVKR